MTTDALKRQFSLAALRRLLSYGKVKALRDYLEELFVPLFATEWGRRASLGASVFFGMLLLATLVETTISWHDDVVITHQPVTKSVENEVNEVAEWNATIPNAHLFGDADVNDQGYVPITSLQLRLVGVIKSAEENVSRVIISEAGQPGKVFAVGDSLPSGIRVYSITDDGVILDNGGHLEKLPMQRPRLNFLGPPKGFAG